MCQFLPEDWNSLSVFYHKSSRYFYLPIQCLELGASYTLEQKLVTTLRQVSTLVEAPVSTQKQHCDPASKWCEIFLKFQLCKISKILSRSSFSSRCILCSSTTRFGYIERVLNINSDKIFQMNIYQHRFLSRLGLMHMIATNLCVWLKVLILETLHEIEESHGSSVGSSGRERRLTSSQQYQYHDVRYLATTSFSDQSCRVRTCLVCWWSLASMEATLRVMVRLTL